MRKKRERNIMEKRIRFLGISIIAAALIIVAGICIQSFIQRYQYINVSGAKDIIFDKVTGIHYQISSTGDVVGPIKLK